jgi:hypothetical protein
MTIITPLDKDSNPINVEMPQTIICIMWETENYVSSYIDEFGNESEEITNNWLLHVLDDILDWTRIFTEYSDDMKDASTYVFVKDYSDDAYDELISHLENESYSGLEVIQDERIQKIFERAEKKLLDFDF